jgi:beta-phosphoglucomutase
MFKALIFDFDGVILDSEPLHYQACSVVFKQLGITISYDEYVKECLGYADKDMFPKFFATRNLFFTVEKINYVMEEKTKQFQAIIRDCDILPMIDAVDQYINYIANKIPKLAICSGSTKNEILAVLAKIKHGSLLTYFDKIVTSEDVKHGKPSPEGYLLTAGQLNLSPSECLVIEDTPHGVDAAKAAGMRVIALTTSYKQEQLQHADQIITHFAQLIPVYD